MLEGLDASDWSSLKHGPGIATDTPREIRKLLSPKKDHREDAIMSLYDSLMHQGTIYSATAKALPFLIEIFRAEEAEDKPGIAMLIAAFISGYGYFEVHARDESSHESWKELLQKQGENFRKECEQEDRINQKIRTLGDEIIPELLPYMENKKYNEPRRSITWALLRYSDRYERYLLFVEKSIKTETDIRHKKAFEKRAAELKNAK
jgi:hypothetical protein